MHIYDVAGYTPPTTEKVSSPNEEMGKEAFLKLLVAELSNQDPLNPLESRDFITQLSQLTGVEQLMGINQGIESLEVATVSLSNAQISDFVGKTVTADASTMLLNDAGIATSVYQLSSRANEVTATIRNDAGKTVRTIRYGDTYPGSHILSWDGYDEGGNRLSEGRYTVEINAKDSNGNPIGTSTEVSGRVTAVSYNNGYPELNIGNARVLLGDVISIAQ